jgi:hypothetical protein
MTTIGPKKDGGPNVDYFQSSESLSQFDQIRVWLQKNCKKVTISYIFNFISHLKHLFNTDLCSKFIKLT